jgi:hypothetical protein
MSDIFGDKKKEIEKETKEIESTIIPQYKKKSEEIGNKLSTTIAEFDEKENEREKDRKLWHEEVDAIFNKFRSLMKSMKENQLAVLKSHNPK